MTTQTEVQQAAAVATLKRMEVPQLTELHRGAAHEYHAVKGSSDRGAAARVMEWIEQALRSKGVEAIECRTCSMEGITHVGCETCDATGVELVEQS